jgi:hypothetical protein
MTVEERLILTIEELRILPPLAFARLGSADKPQPSYELGENTSDPLGFRQIKKQQSFIIDEEGNLTKDDADYSDPNSMFRDKDKIRPVAPFFELYAFNTGSKVLEPLTVEMLGKAQLNLSAIQWRVHVQNRKVFRRTGDTKDIVEADTKFFSDHGRHELHGKCGNFGNDEHYVHFGCVQFVRPGADGAIRLRFTPAKGIIYGPRDDQGRDEIYVPPEKPIYRKGGWPRFDESQPGKGTLPSETLPPSLFANKAAVPPWLNNNRAESRGYFDDVCDGFISVSIKGTELKANARICVGPPSFIPDALFIRTLDDDLDQVINGPTAEDIAVKKARELTLDIVRRGFEAVRFMNVAVMNGNPINGRAAEQFDTMPAEESFATERPVRPVMSPAGMDTAGVMALHRQVYATLCAGGAPWFARLLRKPGEMGDLTDRGRRKMPALMSGADSFYLALTHRQIATVEKAAEAATEVEAKSDATEQGISPRNLSAMLRYKASGNPLNSRPEMAIANCCPGLEVDFRAVWRRLFEGIVLSEHDNYVIEDCRTTANGMPAKPNLKGHRLLDIFFFGPVIAKLKGPSPSDPQGDVPVYSENNPHGVWTMEWSNCLAKVVAAQRKFKAEPPPGAPDKFEVNCVFTAQPAKEPQPGDPSPIIVQLAVRNFFEDETAVISEELAKAGELTQGLCSPWQNDLRECSCFYWASSRPDFVNMTIGEDGLSHGDNWLAKGRTGEYVPDDYADARLIGYDDLFKNWEKQLQFQIGGNDSAPNLMAPSVTPKPDPSKP